MLIFVHGSVKKILVTYYGLKKEQKEEEEVKKEE